METASVILGTVIVDSIPASAAYHIATRHVKYIEAYLSKCQSKHQQQGKKEKEIEQEQDNKQHATLHFEQQPHQTNTFTARLSCQTGHQDAGQIVANLGSILVEKFRTQEYPHATVKVTVLQVEKEKEHVHGKEKKDEAPSYTFKIANQENSQRYPVIYCSVNINGQPASILNPWYTTSDFIADGMDQIQITWTETYSVGLYEVKVKKGNTVGPGRHLPVSLGQRLTFDLENGIPRCTETKNASAPNVIEMELAPGYDYGNWGVGFGITDPLGNNMPAAFVQGGAGMLYKFEPASTMYYRVGLSPSYDKIKKLVNETDLVNYVPIQFTNETEYDLTLDATGRWIIDNPSDSSAGDLRLPCEM